MKVAEDRTRFLLEDETRVRVAELCDGQALTHQEIAAALVRPPGSLSAPVTMEKAGALQAKGKREPGKRGGGLRYRLRPSWRPALQNALLDLDRGLLRAGDDLLLIPAVSVAAACHELLAQASPLQWGVALRGERLGLLLSLSGADHGAASVALLSRLAARGVEAVRIHVEEPLGRHELMDWAKDVTGTGEHAELPPG